MSILKKLKTAPSHPIPWTGPSGEGLNGGVTQSLIGRYLCCKERFRILVIEGLKPHPRFSAPMDFGTMWHACEEAFASWHKDEADPRPAGDPIIWEHALETCVNSMLAQYPRDVEHILHWCSVAQELFPVYVHHWSQHPDVQDRTPLLAEQAFDVPYTLPSGRTVRLRGKWDSVDLVGGGANAGVWNQDNKTKSSIDRAKITRQLTFDLQMMVYQVALQSKYDEVGWAAKGPLRGIRYNVIRRSAHKSAASMMKKVREDLDAGRSSEWFDRFNVTISAADIRKFKEQCLDPVLENLCDDYEWWEWCKETGYQPFNWYQIRPLRHVSRHFRLPYGLYNSVVEGGFGDVDAYMEDGSEAGLQRVTNLFPELQEETSGS